MEIRIMSRQTVEDFAKKTLPEKTAIISITDYGWDFLELENEPEYLLQLEFDDIDADVFVDELGRKPTDSERQMIERKYHMLSDYQADEIAEFYYSVRNKVDLFICQCEHGQSRSAAIAAAIMEHEYASGIKIFASDDYFPNKTIFKKVLNAITRRR